MKIIQSQVFTVEMSFEELIGIKKMIGMTSPSQRMEEMNLTKAQDKALEKLFEMLEEYFVDGVTN